MSKHLVVRLNADGTIAAETFGMTGDECLGYITELENLLEATTTESAFTADYAAPRVSDDVSDVQEDRR